MDLREAIINASTEQTQLTALDREHEVNKNRKYLLWLISVVYKFCSLFAVAAMFNAGGTIGGCVMLSITCVVLLIHQIVSIVRHLKFEPCIGFVASILVFICYAMVYSFGSEIRHNNDSFTKSIAIDHCIVTVASCIAFTYFTRTWSQVRQVGTLYFESV